MSNNWDDLFNTMLIYAAAWSLICGILGWIGCYIWYACHGAFGAEPEPGSPEPEIEPPDAVATVLTPGYGAGVAYDADLRDEGLEQLPPLVDILDTTEGDALVEAILADVADLKQQCDRAEKAALEQMQKPLTPTLREQVEEVLRGIDGW